jgi:hypothetical protein
VLPDRRLWIGNDGVASSRNWDELIATFEEVEVVVLTLLLKHPENGVVLTKCY